MNEWTLALSAAAFVLALLSLILLLRLIKRQPDYERLLRESWNANLPALKTELTGELRASRGELTGTVQTTMKTFADSLALAQAQTAERQDVRLRELIESLEKNQLQLKSTIAETNRILAEAQEKQFAMQDKRMQGIEAQFTAFTAAVQSRLETLQKDNSEQLEKMRVTVDEKLQKTLDERISQSFRLVNERLQEVYTGLGEMKTLANGVGDLKKVLSNVKTRGIVGEYQLGALIDDILTRDQFEENVITKKGSTTRVEYAIKMPGEDGSFVYLPVDSKFPGDVYAQLVAAYDPGDPAAIRSTWQAPAPWRRCSTACRWASARSPFRSARARCGASSARSRPSSPPLRTCSPPRRSASSRPARSWISSSACVRAKSTAGSAPSPCFPPRNPRGCSTTAPTPNNFPSHRRILYIGDIAHGHLDPPAAAAVL